MNITQLLFEFENRGIEAWPSAPVDTCDGLTEKGIIRTQEVVLTSDGRDSVRLDLTYHGKPWSIGLMFGETFLSTLKADCWAIMEGEDDSHARGLLSVLGLPLVKKLANSLN